MSRLAAVLAIIAFAVFPAAGVETDRAAVWRVEPAYTVDGEALLDGVRDLDARRRAGELEAGDYPGQLRSLIDRCVVHALVHI